MTLDSDTSLLNGRYIIERALDDAGAFVLTYRGRDTEHERDVVVTEYFPRSLAERASDGQVTPRTDKTGVFQQGLRYFRKEAKVLRELAHPNLTRELEDFEERGTAYRVSAHRAGASLATALEKNDGSISERAALTVLTPALKALHALHRKGLLHGGFSPEALYLTENRKVLVRGFCGAQLRLARRTSMLGRIAIPGISPAEQYDPDGRQGPWTDVYAAAATLYRAVAGQTLPEASEGPLEEGVVTEHLERADAFYEDVRRVLERALAPRPRGRIQSTRTFAEALDDPAKLLSEEDVSAASSGNPVEPAHADTATDSSTDSSAQMWGPASMAAAAAEAVQRDREKERGEKEAPASEEKKEKVPSRSAEPGSPAGEETRDETGEEERGEHNMRRRVMLVGAFSLVVLLGGAALVFTGVLGGGGEGEGGEGSEGGGQARYEALRAEGDSLLGQADYRAARRRYRRAQAARPSGEAGGYVNKRLREIERKQAAAQTQGYQRAIRRGDSLRARAAKQAGGGKAANRLYTQATEAYLSALQHRPGDSLARAGVRAASARATPGGAGSASGEKSASKKYPVCPICGRRHEPGLHERVASWYREQAAKAFEEGNYAEARRKYKEVLTNAPHDEEAVRKIGEIESRISEADRQKQYRNYRSRGNSFFQAGNLTEARREYQLALDVQPGDSAVAGRLQTIEERLARQKQQQKQYQRYRDQGDAFFDGGEMEKAVKSYGQALGYRPADDYVQRRLAEAKKQAAAAEKAKKREARLRADRTKDGIYKVTDQPPEIVGGWKAFTQKISYPNRARENGVEGRVYLRVTVGADGSVNDVEVTKGIGYGADEEAARAARNTQFKPGIIDGKPVRAYKSLMAPFKLK